jgi:hypothetical protein
VDLVDEHDLAVAQGGQHRGGSAKPLDVGPLVIRSGVPSSAEMIMAMVVLPSPGGGQQHVVRALPRRSAPASSRDSCSRTRAWPMKSFSRLGRSVLSITRSSASASGDTSRSVSAGSAITSPPSRCERPSLGAGTHVVPKAR